MEKILKTKVDEKLFGARAIVDNKLKTGEHYIYAIKYKDAPYLLKGQTICLEHVKPEDENTK